MAAFVDNVSVQKKIHKALKISSDDITQENVLQD